MNPEVVRSPLVLHLSGPAVAQGRLPLADLVEIGRHVQTGIERVARLIRGYPTSLRRGKLPQEIAAACALEIVAFESGSVQIVLDLPHNQAQLDAFDLGEHALEALVNGLADVSGDAPALPVGYDAGVLLAVRDIGRILDRGVDEIELRLATRSVRRNVRYDKQGRDRVARRVHEPLSNQRTVEGLLLMADFKESGTRCRVHTSWGEVVNCTFEDQLADQVQDVLRKYVRVTGPAQQDPVPGRIMSLAIADIEPVEPKTPWEGGADFWTERSVRELAEEAGLDRGARFDDVRGRGAALWESDEDLEEFLRGIHARRREEPGA